MFWIFITVFNLRIISNDQKQTFGFVYKIRCSFMKKSALQHFPTINSVICFTIFFYFTHHLFLRLAVWISSWLLLMYKPAGWSVTGNGIHSLDNSLFFGFEPVPPCWITANRSEPSPYTVLHARVFNQKVSVICGLLPGHALVHRIREEWNSYEWGMGEERLTGRGVVFQGSFTNLSRNIYNFSNHLTKI